MKPLRFLVIGVVLAALARCGDAAAAETWPADAPAVTEAVRRLMQDRNYAEAVKAIDAAATAADAPKDYLAYLKGRALALQGRYDEAAAAFDAMQKSFPKSDWLRRARFAKATALARKGDFRSAEVIVRAEAEYLLSTDRKQQIADIYLEFADVLFKPPKDDVKPDYAKAYGFYQKALDAGPKPEKRIEVELRAAQCQQNTGKYGEAIALYEKFIADHSARHVDRSPDKTAAKKMTEAAVYSELAKDLDLPVSQPSSADPLLIEAYFRLGECRLAEGNGKVARRVWQDLLVKYGNPESKDDGSRFARIADAQYQLAQTWGIYTPQSDEDLNLGVSALRAFIERFPTHKLASTAHLDIGKSYIYRGRYDDAATVLRRFLADARYQNREEIPDARQLLGRCLQFQKKFPEAIAAWRDFLVKHPSHKQWSYVQREIIDTEYLMAKEKYVAKQYADSNRLFGEFLAKYPLDERVPNALLTMACTASAQEKWDEAIAAWRRIISKYPDANEASLAQLYIAETLETKLNKLEEALEEYRKITRGPGAGPAQHAVARLTATSMTISTERVFRSDETPKLKLVSRNVETVTVRAYKVDMETYFRKMHLARGVEGLDISLIDPDKTFEFKVPNYAKHRQSESAIEVPLPGGAKTGVMAVTVSGKTLEATTLVIQSDLDVVVKSSRDEVFVFAENMRTGKPWPGARLLISNGRQVFAEEKSGGDGVFQKSYKELKDAGDVRVFAVADGSVASNAVDLQGVGVAQGLSDKGYIYTDRPAYRAGQVVHVRGCLRRAVGDVYTIEKDKQFTLDLLGPSNRLLARERVKLGPFGSFHTYFVLPSTSQQATYRVFAHDDAGQSYSCGFVVQEYQLEPVRISIDTPRSVYYRGEEIEGTIRAAYYYGAPLAGREIRYRLADQREFTATTDAKGEVRFKLPTREFGETQTLTLHVTLPERNLHTLVNYMLSAQGFSIEASVVRPVYVAGETFETTVTTKDAEGKPIAEKLTLKVFEMTTVDRTVGERLVEEYKIETAAADGLARKTLKIAKGGTFIVRLEGIDRFHNAVTGQCQVQISDDKDETRLRILADTHTYKVGDTAAIKVHWRERPSLALVTFQGARVLDYRLVELKPGVNELTIPMVARLAPNFDLSIAVMTTPPPQGLGTSVPSLRDREKSPKPIARFHEATSPFAVERDLRVKIVAKRKDGRDLPVRPGDEIEVSIATTDLQDKPVTAEVSLAMVEQSLLDRFGKNVSAINDFFRGVHRESAVRTTSSITFAYDPQTQPINPRLLAEEDRIALAEEEETALKTCRPTEPAAPQSAAMGRETQSLMMSVTPKIVIQNEEEEKLDDPFADAKESGLVGTGEGRGRGMSHGPGKPGRRVKLAQTGGTVALSDSSAYDVSRYQWRRWDSDKHFAEPDFDSLVDILAANVHPEDWQAGRQASSPATKHDAVSAERYAQIRAAILAMMGETAYWNPSITTDKDGRAKVTFTVPERSTAWRLLAKGITTDTLAGEANETLVVKKELFGQLKLPQSFTDGDQAELVASICNDAVAKGPIDVTLRMTIGGKTVEQKKTITVDGKGIQEVKFPVDLKGEREEGSGEREAIAFELTVAAGERRDVSRRTVPLLPYGVPVYAAASGVATADATAWVESPTTMKLQRPSLSILIGPTVDRSLLDVLFAEAPPCQCAISRIASDIETATSDLMAAIGLQRLLGVSRDATGPQAEALDARIRSAVSLLVSSQNNDGGWGWTGTHGVGERYATSRAVWALSLARKAGYNVPDDQFQKSLALLQRQITAVADTDYESKAILLHALSTAGHGDFALANRLHRERLQLSTGALAYLALAFVEMDRKPMAAELLDVLAKRDLDNVPARRTTAEGSLPWCQSPAELHALCALALEQVAPQGTKTKAAVDWLMAHRVGHRWSPDKATGPAAMALCRWAADTRFDGERYTLKVFVNDTLAKTLDVDPKAGTQTIEVPGKMLKGGGRQRVNFQIAGRGRYSYQCILGGFVPADKLAATTDDWKIQRTYEPAPLEMDGRQVSRGFNIVRGDPPEFKNPLTQLPVGGRGQVTLELRRSVLLGDVPDEQLEYLVVTEPIPAGATVVENSVHGGFERFELTPGAITFYVGNRRHVADIEYEVYGYLQGNYRTVPTVVRNAYRPEQMAVSTPKSLAVLPQGAKSSDPYRLSPNELLAIGRRCYEKKDYATAGQRLSELMKGWTLKPDEYKQAVQMLLDIHLELGPPAQVVRYFEIVKEKWPQEEIPFAKIMKVAAAYHEMGEYERSYLVFRATVEGNFRRETTVAGFLEAQGQFTRSVDVLSRLLREYPPEAYVAEANYSLAQHVYAKASSLTAVQRDPTTIKGQGMWSVASSPAAADGRPEKLNRIELLRRAWTMLESFLTAYPDDPAADQAALADAGVLLDLRAYKEAAAACDLYAKRYPKSELLDAYWYIIGYCHFASGQHEAALEMCRKVADTKRIDPATGREEDCRNKWQAIYILGQVYHSLGKAVDAIREYRRVEDKFVDAKQAIDYFLRKAIELPEVTTFKPGEPAEVELKFGNVARCDLKVYRIDLMKFGLLKRNLAGIAEINLAGIRPLHETSVTLGDGRDYRDRTRKLPLPLKDEGAYLIVCRGDDLHASGLALVTPLAVEVQADPTSGRVRTTVKDRVADKYLHDVHVKVIGSNNADFVSGQTDLRGVFVADGISGGATVIAQAASSRYAFYRAKEALDQAALARTIRRPLPVAAARAANRAAPSPGSSFADDPDIQRLNEALNSPTTLDFKETPLEEVVDYLKQKHGIEIQLDKRVLEDVNVTAETPVTIHVKNVSLKAALKFMFRNMQPELTYMFKDGMLLITTPDIASEELTTKVYPVGDLVLPEGATEQEQADFDTLIDILTGTVKPTTWDEVGAPGSVRGDPQTMSLIVSQTQEVHEDIQKMIDKLRKVGREQGGRGLPAVKRDRAQRRGAAGMGGAGGGMGGMMGGMGGQQMRSSSQQLSPAAKASPSADLLQGVRGLNEGNQSKQSGKLQQMYNENKGGVGAGDAF
jgi:alpha-2-macroglobulin